jgi:hypothetical protein
MKNHRDPMLPRQTDRCQCAACGLYFRSSRGFSKHRTGSYGGPGQPASRRCLTPDEMLAAGYVLLPSGHWGTGGGKPAFLANTHTQNSGDRLEPLQGTCLAA